MDILGLSSQWSLTLHTLTINCWLTLSRGFLFEAECSINLKV